MFQPAIKVGAPHEGSQMLVFFPQELGRSGLSPQLVLFVVLVQATFSQFKYSGVKFEAGMQVSDTCGYGPLSGT